MQGLADGYFVLPNTIPNYLAEQKPGAVKSDSDSFKQVESDVNAFTEKLLNTNGTRSPRSLHQELGHYVGEMWDVS